MGTTNATPAVPRDFEDYLAAEHATPTTRQPCDGCGRDDLDCWRIYNDVQCEACLRGWHNDEKAELRTLQALIGGAVKAALALEIKPALIRAVVEDAIDESVEREVRALRAGLEGRMPADELDARLMDADQAWRS